MPAERVVIDIEVNSDIATIEATREALERLTNAQKRYNRERERGRGSGGGGGGDDDDDDGGSRGRRGRRGGGGGGGRKRVKGRYDGLGGDVFDFRGDMGKGIAAYGKLLGMVNKLSAIALPAMMAALGGISLAFKAGTYFVKMYQAAMASMASAIAVGFIALTTFLAAQKEYSAVQNSSAYSAGSLSTTDRFIAAGEAMSMFTDNTRLATIGSKGLQAAFSTLSKVKPVDGATTAAFEGLMNVVAGSGGDIEKGAGKLADFLAAVQKKGSLAGGAAAAKELGPDFEKIVKEAGALGIKTSDEFLKAAADGQLGETFALKYAGTLDALNNTVMGRFKSAVTSIKGLMTDLGGDYLGETGQTISKLQTIVETFIIRLNNVLKDFDMSGKMGGFLDKVEKGTNALIVLISKYLNTSPNIFQFFNGTITRIGNAFDAMQDWMRQFQAAGELINKYFFKPLFSSLGTNFTTSMTSLAETIEKNKKSITGLATQISKTLTAIGKYGDVVRKLFIGAIPVFSMILKMVEGFFNGLAKFGKIALSISSTLKSMGLGKAGAIVNVAALYALFTLATRFFKIFGTMFGKNMNKGQNTKLMNVRAGVVNMNGSPMGGVGGSTSGLTNAQTSGRGYLTARQRMQGYGRQGSNMMGGMGSMIAGGAMLAGGSMISGKGNEMIENGNSAGGGALKALGTTAQIGGLGVMMLGGSGIKALGSASQGAAKVGTKIGSSTIKMAPGMAGAAALAGGAAIVGGSYAAGSVIGSKFNDDSVKSRGTSAAASALAGAAIGATIGSFIPIIGTGIGAAIGAGIGGITGYMKAGKQRKETRKAAKELVEGYASQVSDAMAGGNIDEMQKARKDMEANRKKMILENKDPAYAAKSLEKYTKEMAKASTQIDNYTSNAGMAEKYLGVGAESLNAFAKDKGINIEDKMLNLRDVIKIVGKDTQAQAALMKAAWANIGANAVSGAFDYFTNLETSKEQSKLVDATANKINGGDGRTETANDYLKALMQFNIAESGDIEGLVNAGKTLEEQLGPGGRFENISEEQKLYMRETAAAAGMSGQGMLDKIDMTELSGLLSTSSTLINKIGADPKDATKIDPKKLMAYLSTEMAAGNTDVLLNLMNATKGLDAGQVERDVQNVLAYGSKYGSGGPSGILQTTIADEEDDRKRRRYGDMNNNVMPAAPQYNTVNTYVSGILDRTIVNLINENVAKQLREQRERGSSMPSRIS